MGPVENNIFLYILTVKLMFIIFATFFELCPRIWKYRSVTSRDSCGRLMKHARNKPVSKFFTIHLCCKTIIWG